MLCLTSRATTAGLGRVNHGFALNHSTDPTAADSMGQFSSSVIYDAAEKLW